MTLHTEWYWLNIYDKDGEIGKQVLWNPDAGVTGIWKDFLSNIVYGKGKSNQKSVESEKRLQELRNKQGSDVEYFKDEFFSTIKIDQDKAM